MGNQRNRAKEIVGAHVQHHCNAGCHQEQHHLHYRLAHNEQHHEYHGKAYQDYFAYAAHYQIVPVNLDDRLVSEIL